MKTVETTFTPSDKSDNGVAEGTFTITGTDKEVQSFLNKISEIKDTTICLHCETPITPTQKVM